MWSLSVKAAVKLWITNKHTKTERIITIEIIICIRFILSFFWGGFKGALHVCSTIRCIQMYKWFASFLSNSFTLAQRILVVSSDWQKKTVLLGFLFLFVILFTPSLSLSLSRSPSVFRNNFPMHTILLSFNFWLSCSFPCAWSYCNQRAEKEYLLAGSRIQISVYLMHLVWCVFYVSTTTASYSSSSSYSLFLCLSSVSTWSSLSPLSYEQNRWFELCKWIIAINRRWNRFTIKMMNGFLFVRLLTSIQLHNLHSVITRINALDSR